jgi:chromosome segregation ATPase
MLKELVEFGKKLFDLVRTSREHDERINKLTGDVASLTRRFDELAEEVRELSFEMRQDRESRARERELLRLQLENVLLRFERRLPPAREPGDPPELA